MSTESFRERNRKRREENAFETFYGYARRTRISEPKKTAQQSARSIHGENGAAAPPARGGEAPVPIPHRLEDRTRDQLYERAQELEIQGRSQMTKDELVEAIRRR